MKSSYSLLGLALMLLLTGSKAIAEPVKLALTHIPKVLEYNLPQAPYTRLIAELKKSEKLNFETVYLPSARANKLLNSRQLDCIFPIIPTRTRVQATEFSQPVNGIYAHIFSLGPTVFQNVHQLKGKSVVYLRGYLFGDLIKQNTDIHFLPVNSQQAAYAMLRKNRADAYIDYVPDIKFVFSRQQLNNLNFAPNSPIIKAYDRCECLTTPAASKFIALFNEEINRLRKSGQLEDILGDYFVSTH